MANEHKTSIFEEVTGAGIIGIFVLILAVLAVVLSPIWVPFYIYDRLRERAKQRRFLQYLSENEGAKFFCYTNRKTSEELVETRIVPYLGDDVKVFRISDKYWRTLSDDETFEFSIVLEMSTEKGGFPYVSKVVNGELVTRSVNNRLYSAITRKADADGILREIEKFYS